MDIWSEEDSRSDQARGSNRSANDSGANEADRGAFNLLLALQIIGSVFAVVANAFGGMDTGNCGPETQCSDALLNFVSLLTPCAALVLLILTIAFGIRLHKSSRARWWVPLVAIAVMTLVFLVATNLHATAVHAAPSHSCFIDLGPGTPACLR